MLRNRPRRQEGLWIDVGEVVKERYEKLWCKEALAEHGFLTGPSPRKKRNKKLANKNYAVK
jgi:hypothetical protein